MSRSRYRVQDGRGRIPFDCLQETCVVGDIS